ncbi:Vegetative incompatibility protein HET-E-1 [Fusarium culmorum]|uniref:Vegetative incompatibility protein HET-E-1 n=1 Tax=Fusarium culmorum TaxID=5516 RepID=A0A2T4GY10_FUSCU|nr:Vegetative incompatibility protein HET-E-1 [Fusarium culmorum]
MWLINTSTIELQRVDGEDLEWTLYAILSHTWGKDEVTFEEMILSGQPNHKLGYAKIENTYRLEKERGIAYVWVDTCCIDKRSSAELAKAINSISRWYRCATLGILSMVHMRLDTFYDSAWQHRGTKSGLQDRISDITIIDITILKSNKFLKSILIDKHISWAINRKTTRIKDLTYCLISIFNINMPIIYGEGTKEANDTTQDYRGILAQSPAEFAHCRRLSRAPSMRHGCEITKTDKGLRLETFLGKSNILNLSCLLSNDDE